MTRAVWRRAVASLRPGTPTTLVDAAPAMTLGEVLRRFAPRLRPLRSAMLLSLVLLAAAPAIEVVELLLFQRLVDDVLVPADLGPLPMLVALYVALNLGSAVVSGADDYLSTWISQRFLVGLRTDLFEHLLASPQHAHRRRRLGDMMSRLTSDTAAVESFMVGQLTEVVGALLRIGIFVTALFWLQWELALASMVVVPLLWWASTAFARFIRSVSREKRRRSGSMSAVSQERLETAPLAQSLGREREAVDAFHRENVAVGAASLAASRVRAVFLPLVDLAELAGTLAVIALGTWALATDRLTLGGLLAFLALLAQCHRPVRDLADLIPSLYSATAGVERIVEVLDSPVPQDRPDARDLGPVTGRITLEDVWVRYPGAGTDALRGLDLEVSPGEVVAVVGPSGAGKTTLTRLLTRYVEPDRGRVLLDGHDLAGATAASVRAQVTVVLQETLLLDADVRDNIAFARPDASAEEVERAARAADAHAFVSALPDGYATRLGARGASLSGGQRQRLSMARALLRDTPVLVLDEPTAGLDPATAERVLGPLLAASRRRTVVLVTHDPVALAHADRVVHLEAGRCVRPTGPVVTSAVPS